jgi:hypothetical protein
MNEVLIYNDMGKGIIKGNGVIGGKILNSEANGSNYFGQVYNNKVTIFGGIQIDHAIGGYMQYVANGFYIRFNEVTLGNGVSLNYAFGGGTSDFSVSGDYTFGINKNKVTLKGATIKEYVYGAKV